MTAKNGILDTAVEASPAAITDLISRQSGGITSRTLLELPATTVTLFSFDAGQALSEHTAPFHALVQVVAGTLEIRIGQEEHTVEAGMLIVMPPDVPHALRATETTTMILTMARM